MRVLAYADHTDDPAGLLGLLLRARGHEVVVVDRGQIAPPGFDGVGLTVHLGSAVGPFEDEHRERVEAEAAVVRGALEAGVPVLGICYGVQLIAHALGGTTAMAPVAERGLVTVESADPVLCPAGPWLQSHQHTFTLPPGARELGRTAAGPQGVAYEGERARALGWQFHPETMPAKFVERSRDSAAWADAPEPVERVAERMLDEKADFAERSARLLAAGLDWLGVA